MRIRWILPLGLLACTSGVNLPMGGPVKAVKRLNLMQIVGLGDMSAMRSRVRSLEEELRDLHIAHGILIEELRQLRAKRAKEHSEYQRLSVSYAQEMQRVTDQVRAETEAELQRVEGQAKEDLRQLEERLVEEAEEERRALERSLREEGQVALQKVVTKALADQARQYDIEIARIQAEFEQRLQREVREAGERATNSRQLEEELDATQREVEELRASHEKQLLAERRRGKKRLVEEAGKIKSAAEETEAKLRMEMAAMQKSYEEQIAALSAAVEGQQQASPLPPSTVVPKRKANNGTNDRPRKARPAGASRVNK